MVVLGSTGSIGVNTLEIAKKYNIKIEALVAGNNYKLLNEQIKKFNPEFVAVKDKKTALKIDFENVKYGEEAILEIIEKSKSSLVVNALVGDAGLKPTLKAQECGKKIALANKESLVNAGKFIDTSKITPIDSEHFGLWYLLNGKWKMENGKCGFNKLYITASGGALRDWDVKNIQNAGLKDVLNHPNWSMGVKITIDSATMVNKLFELLEAKWLFNTSDIDAFIETKSIIHALVEWVDGSTTAHISKTDMKLPIAFAVSGKVNDRILEPVNLLEVGKLEFRKIDCRKYPVWEIKDPLLENPDLGVVVNTANEYVTKRFIKDEIGFTDISGIILKSVKKFGDIQMGSVDDVFLIKREVAEFLRRNYG
ncbi:1-deoxy-D-xylulose-5-phosphate reductoisomerase [Nautilia sp.]